jgi:hypothetical protein
VRPIDVCMLGAGLELRSCEIDQRERASKTALVDANECISSFKATYEDGGRHSDTGMGVAQQSTVVIG